MRVTLVYPPMIYPKNMAGFHAIGLGILYLAAALRDAGHEVTLIDAIRDGMDNMVRHPDDSYRVGLDPRDVIKRIPRNSEAIGVSVLSLVQAALAHDLLAEIKAAFPAVPLLLGGAYPSGQPQMALQSAADYIVRGEAEETMCKLLDYLRSGGSLPAGVATRESDLDSVQPQFIADLNARPWPARDLIDTEYYLRRSVMRTAEVITSRGCPFHCEFCAAHASCGRKWRSRSPDDVLREIDHIVERYDVRCINIQDDMFSLNRERAVEIIDGIAKRNLRWTAQCGFRIDTVDEKLLETIGRSRCRNITLPLENGDPDVLKLMNKKIDRDRVVDILKAMRSYDIPVGLFIIYGYPGETEERFRNAVRFYRKLKLINPRTRFHFMPARPFPGTALFTRCVENGDIDPRDYVDPLKMPNSCDDFPIETADFDRRESQRRLRVLSWTVDPLSTVKNGVNRLLPRSVRPYVAMGRSLLGRLQDQRASRN